MNLQRNGAGSDHYEVFAFSRQRATAHCRVTYSTDGGASFPEVLLNWTQLGGALVDVGAVQRGPDSPGYFEVKTPNNGKNSRGNRATNDTRALLFDVGQSEPVVARNTYASRFDPVFNEDRVPGIDRDAMVGPGLTAREVAGGTDSPRNLRHLLLVGKIPPRRVGIPTFLAAPEIERQVELVAGPVNTDDLSAPLSLDGPVDDPLPGTAAFAAPLPEPGCGGWMAVPAGRFTGYFVARHTSPPGHVGGAANDACALVNDADCQSFDDNHPYDYRRGAFQRLAFQMRLEESEGPGVRVLSSREVPSGAFGADNHDHRFTMPIDSDGAHAYRICLSNVAPEVSVGPFWYAQRNLFVAGFNVATNNTMKHTDNDAQFRNASNLYATRGYIDRNAGAVRAYHTQAPFQWGADIVGLQEVYNAARQQTFVDEAEANSGEDWRWVLGKCKENTSFYERQCGLFVNPFLVRNETSITPLKIPGDGLCDHGSSADTDADAHTRCYLDDLIDVSGFDFSNWAVPGRTEVHRWGIANDQPIAAFSLILEPHGGSAVHARHNELDQLIKAITEQLEKDPSMFHVPFSGPEGEHDPRHSGNRILLMGDFNTYPHEYGEHYWVLRKLREAFGYAVDVALAAPGAFSGMYGMHDHAATGLFAYQSSILSGEDYGNGFAAYPNPFTRHKEFNDIPEDYSNKYFWGQSQPWPHFFPYWARSYKGEQENPGSGSSFDRHDGVLLVGRGWAQDDPVQGYVVLNTFTKPSPFALVDAHGNVLAVDLWAKGTDAVPNGVQPNGVQHYHPRYANEASDPDNCTGSGCTAIHTDHLPVATRLQVVSW